MAPFRRGDGLRITLDHLAAYRDAKSDFDRGAALPPETMEGLLGAYDAVNDVGDDDDGDDDDSAAFSDICWGHDDYIWQLDNGSGSDERGPVGFSVYFSCDITREDRAGENEQRQQNQKSFAFHLCFLLLLV